MVSKASKVEVRGPLATYVSGFHEELRQQHYTPLSAANQLRVLAHLSRWLESKKLDAGGLSARSIEQFLRARRRAGYTRWLSLRGLAPLLGYLRRIGVAPVEAAPKLTTPVQRLVAEYVEHLRRERGIVEASVRFRQSVALELLTSSSVSSLTADLLLRACCRRTAVGRPLNQRACPRSYRSLEDRRKALPPPRRLAGIPGDALIMPRRNPQSRQFSGLTRCYAA